MATIDKYRSRNFRFVLYPDDPNHVNALELIKEKYMCAYILHDKDVENDVLKKAHWHVVIAHNNPLWNTSVCKGLGLELNYCMDCSNLDKALEYLIHFNNVDKYQYSVDDVKGDLVSRLKERIEKGGKTESMKILDIIDYVEKNSVISVTALGKWCALNGYWAEFRRSYSFFRDLCHPVNISKFQ